MPLASVLDDPSRWLLLIGVTDDQGSIWVRLLLSLVHVQREISFVIRNAIRPQDQDIEEYRETIAVESVLGEGTRIRIELPAKES